MKSVFSVALAVGWRMVHNNFSNPSLMLPGLAFPLFFFVAFAGGLSRVNDVPGFQFPVGYTAFQFVFVLLQTATVLTVVALAAGMQVGGDGVDIFALYALALLVNACGLLWSAGVAMRFRTLQAAPLMQLPVFLCLFFAPVFVPVDLLADWLRVIAHLNPVTLLLEAGRSLIAGTPTHVGYAFAAAVALVAAFSFWAVRGLRKAEAAGGG
jgi:ABC-2 type transport system permease protein